MRVHQAIRRKPLVGTDPLQLSIPCHQRLVQICLISSRPYLALLLMGNLPLCLVLDRLMNFTDVYNWTIV